jgi:hypothetical protein
MSLRKFTPSEQETLRQFMRTVSQSEENDPTLILDDLHKGPDTYIAEVPAGGIPALIDITGTGGDSPGSATCTFYRIDSNGDLKSLGFSRTVYNVSDRAITQSDESYVPVIRSKGGPWITGCGSSVTPCTTDISCFNGTPGPNYKATINDMGDLNCVQCPNMNSLYTVTDLSAPFTSWSVNLGGVCSQTGQAHVTSDQWFLFVTMSCTDSICRLDGSIVNVISFSQTFPPGFCQPPGTGPKLLQANETHLFSHTLPAGQLYQPLTQYTLTHDSTTYTCTDALLQTIDCPNCPPTPKQKCETLGGDATGSPVVYTGTSPEATIVMDFTAP